MSENLKFIGLCGSLRTASRNMGLLRYALANLPQGVSMEIAEIQALPFYIEGMEKTAAAVKLVDQFNAADAVVLACPEYNYSMAPALKNALDWLSREPNLGPLSGKACAILGAGSGSSGSMRAQYHLRQTLVYFDMHPLNRPEIFCNAYSASFAPNGDLVDEKIQERVKTMLQALADWTRRLRG